MTEVVVAIVIGAVLYWFLILRRGKIDFWKAAARYPDAAYEHFKTAPCWKVFEGRLPDNYRAIVPESEWAGPFRLWVPQLSGKQIVVFGRFPELERSQNDFLRGTMGKWSTVDLSMNLLSVAFESYRELRTPAMLEARIPYTLTRVEDTVSQSLKIGVPLPESFSEQRYYIMDGPRLAATLDAAFHESEGLVNLSFLLQPTEILKRRAVKKIFLNHVVPYAATHIGSKGWQDQSLGQHLSQHCLVDKRRSLVLQARLYLEKPVSFGLAVIELKYSGLDAAE